MPPLFQELFHYEHDFVKDLPMKHDGIVENPVLFIIIILHEKKRKKMTKKLGMECTACINNKQL